MRFSLLAHRWTLDAVDDSTHWAAEMLDVSVRTTIQYRLHEYGCAPAKESRA